MSAAASLFLRDQWANNDLALCSILEQSGPQELLALLERIFSTRHGLATQQEGKSLHFVHGPAHWGAVPLAVGARALIFLRSISGRFYEAPWNGHLVVVGSGKDCEAIYPASSLWVDPSVPQDLRKFIRQAPAQPNASAIKLEPLLAYLIEHMGT